MAGTAAAAAATVDDFDPSASVVEPLSALFLRRKIFRVDFSFRASSFPPTVFSMSKSLSACFFFENMRLPFDPFDVVAASVASIVLFLDSKNDRNSEPVAGSAG